MPAKIRLSDGRDLTVQLSGKRVVDELLKAGVAKSPFVRLNSVMRTPVWIALAHVAAVEDRPDLE